MIARKLVLATGLAAAVGTAASGATLTHTFDISGLDSEGDFGTNFPTLSHAFGGAGTVTMIEYDVNYEAFDPSFAEEAAISIDTDGGFFDKFGQEEGAPAAPGVFAYTATEVVALASLDGNVDLTLWEGFDDAASTPDATYGANSTVTVTFEEVPEPGSLALLGLGGLALLRRRR